MTQSKKPKKTTKSSKLNWPPSSDTPVLGDVLIGFEGLFGIAYNPQTGACEVGVHCKASKHEFLIEVIELDMQLQTLNLLYSFKPQKKSDIPGGTISIDVKNPTTPGISFFLPYTKDDQEWTRMPDFESPLFHDQPLKKKPGALSPRVYISNGLFFTLWTTSKQFERVGNNTLTLGRIAYIPGATISHKADGYVVLRFGSQELQLQGNGNRKYFVIFFNTCPKCNYDSKSAVKEKRNDFHLYYKTFKKPRGAKEFQLRLKGGIGPASAARDKRSLFVDFLTLKALSKFGPFSSQDSPCGAAGFGRSNGL